MQLDALFEKMKMEHLGRELESICEQASKRELNYKEFLAEALELEWRGRHLRGVESRLTQARFPWVKTLEQFDFNFQPSVDRKVVRELSGLSFVERAENVVLLGPPGVGKTHLAIALGVKAVGRPVIEYCSSLWKRCCPGSCVRSTRTGWNDNYSSSSTPGSSFWMSWATSP
jgi:DNA replication protein DnaC